MLALIIIVGILVLLGLLLLLPVGFRADYDAQGLKLRLQVACFRFLLYPGQEKPKKEKKRKQKKKKQEKEDADQSSEEKQQEDQKKKLGNLKWLLELTEPMFRALEQLRRRLKISLMRIDYSIGGASDPAEAAIRYGIVSAGGGALFPLLNAAFDVRHWDVNLGVDFDRDESQVALAAVGTWMLGTLLRILLSFGICAFKAYRKQSSKTDQKADQKITTTKEDIQNGRKASDR